MEIKIGRLIVNQNGIRIDRGPDLHSVQESVFNIPQDASIPTKSRRSGYGTEYAVGSGKKPEQKPARGL